MAQTATEGQILLARLVVALIIALIALGVIWYGITAGFQQRFWHDIAERPGGPMTFRFVLQPIMAAIAAAYDGVKDARGGRSPYFWTVLSDPTKRGGRLREGVVSTARIILLGLAMDAVYQLTVLKTFYPGEMVMVALLLAFIPYLLLRGPFERLAHWWLARKAANPTS
jgi:hypothetical protein